MGTVHGSLLGGDRDDGNRWNGEHTMKEDEEEGDGGAGRPESSRQITIRSTIEAVVRSLDMRVAASSDA